LHLGSDLKGDAKFYAVFLHTILENRQIIIALRLETLKGFAYRRTGFGVEERRTKRGNKKTDQPNEDKKRPQVKQTGLDHK
jgi:hypothetical protein